MEAQKRITVKQMNEHVYLLDDAHESTGYLVVGSRLACVIDTMNGIEDLHAVVRAITDKPLVVINTHGHPDHIYGNVFFDHARMHPADLPLADQFINDPEFQELCRQNHRTMPPFTDIRGGDSIDLGDLTLEVYDIPGHTPGGILLLLKEDRILFTGDSINHHLWMQLEGCLSMENFIPQLEKLLFLEEKADWILHGHAQGYDDISLLRALWEGAKEIVAGHTENDQPYHWFGGTDMYHPFKKPADKHFQQEDSCICYRKNNIHSHEGHQALQC